MMTMWSAGTVTLTTCSTNTEFTTRITMYRGVPMQNGTLGEVVAESEESSLSTTDCASLSTYVYHGESFFVVVEGAAQRPMTAGD